MNQKQALDQALRNAGSQMKLADLVGVSQSTVCQWVNIRGVSGDYALKVALATGVSVHDLRPDLYPIDVIKVKKQKRHQLMAV